MTPPHVDSIVIYSEIKHFFMFKFCIPFTVCLYVSINIYIYMCGAQEEEDRCERQSSLGKTPLYQNPDTQAANREDSDSESWHSNH